MVLHGPLKRAGAVGICGWDLLRRSARWRAGDDTETRLWGRECPLKILDIAGERPRRREFARRVASEGHEIVTVPGRREALELLKEGSFDLAVLDAYSDLYD